MAHGDQRGLVLPPVVAPVQAILIPIAAKKEGVLEAVAALRERLAAADIRVDSDISDNSPGWKFNEWEMKGVPLRIELGPRDIEAGKMVLVRRDTHEKIEADLCNAETVVKELFGKDSEKSLRTCETEQGAPRRHRNEHGRDPCGRGKRQLRKGGLVRLPRMRG